MKKIALTLATVWGAIYLSGCQGTSNSSTPAASYSSCYNGVCGATTTSVCNGQAVTYNPTTGTYTNMYGQPVACTTGTTTVGAGLGTGTGGCYYWDSIYPGNQYVPMIDPTSGQLECINVTSYGMTVPTGYNYSTPVSYVQPCSYQDPSAAYNPSCWQSSYGYGGGYGSNYGYSGSSGVCLGAGDDSGGFFGLCF